LEAQQRTGTSLSVFRLDDRAFWCGIRVTNGRGVAVLADAIGIQWSVGGATLLLTPVAIFYFLFVPGIRRMG